jgi:hypothetical protein
VLREHVPSDDTDACAAMLANLGYSVVCVEMDGSKITGQSRKREFLCGVRASSGVCPIGVFSQRKSDYGLASKIHETNPIASCLTTHRTRFDGSDNYILEPGRGLRILDGVERERLQGFDDGWTAGVSERQRARLTGNALITHKANWLGRRLLEAES